MHIKLIFILCCLLVFNPAASFASDKAPLEVGGFKLGSSIDDYDFISYHNFLKEVVVRDIDGFRKGTIYYGICDRPGELVKIKLKYLDSSAGFYKKLLKRYKKKFGKPDAFIGDSFGIVKAWKWTFVDENNNKILLRLQHNLKNPDESLGVTVKLEMPEQIEAERICFNKQCAMNMPKKNNRMRSAWSEESWQNMLPQ